MYQSHFELHRMLFQGGDRSRQFFRTQSIREVSPRLLRGLRNSLGPCLLTARHGAGRTAFLRQIQRELEHDGRAIVVSAASVDSTPSLMKLILHCIARPSAGVSNPSSTECPELTHWAVIQHLQKSVDFWGPVFLILDDIHLLSPALLNELRALSEEEWQGRGLVRILASAPLSFEMQLARPEHQSFAQRLCCHEVLAPLTASESLQLLRLEIESAGGQPERVFSESAAALLTSASEGLPRQLSLLANEALTVAADLKLRPADETSVRAALKQIQHLSLTWNLPASVFDDEADGNEWHQSQSIETHETLSRQTNHWIPGVVEVGVPFITTSEPTPDPEPLVSENQEAATESPEALPTPTPQTTCTPQPLTQTTFELHEPVNPVEPVSRMLWDPDCADFSSVSPIHDRCSEPLNFGLISGHTEVFEAAGLPFPPAPPAALNIPELHVSDSEVIPILEVINSPEAGPAAHNHGSPAVSPSPIALQPEFTRPVDVSSHQPYDTAETVDEGILRLNNSGLELFHAYSGRRLTAAPPIHSERVAGDFSTSGNFSDSPVSVPLWRDGALLEQTSGFTPTPEKTNDSDKASDPQTAIDSSDVQAEATERFATLFTRLRKLQSRDKGLQGTESSGDPSNGTRH